MVRDRGGECGRDGGGVSLGADENSFPFERSANADDLYSVGDFTTEKLQARSNAHLGYGCEWFSPIAVEGG